MLRKLLFLPFAFCASLSVAQPPPEAQIGYASIRAHQMRALLGFLASDALEGRESGTRGLDLAARFLEAQFSLYGLGPAPGAASMLQTFDFQMTQITPQTSIKVQSGKTPAHEYHWLEDFFGRGLDDVPAQLEGRVVFAGYGIVSPEDKWDDYEGLDVRDKIVLLLHARGLASLDTSKVVKLRKKLRLNSQMQVRTAQEKGARAVLFMGPASIPEMIKDFRRFLERPSIGLPEAAAATGFLDLTVSEALANDLLAETGESAQTLQAKIAGSNKPVTRTLKKTRITIAISAHLWLTGTQNVVAYLEGSDPTAKRQVVVFSAHYDHLGIREDGMIYNGADDDGSGTTAILEIAQAFASNPVRPKRSVLFIAHTGEEKGLLGSAYFTSHPLVPLEQIATNLNIDMIGRNDSNRVYIIGSDFLSSELHQINESASKMVGLDLDYTFNDVNDPNRFYFRSDHFNYAKRGIPIIFYFTGLHDDYHKPTDDADKINHGKIEKIARLIYLTGWQVANLDHALRIDRTAPAGSVPASAGATDPGGSPTTQP